MWGPSSLLPPILFLSPLEQGSLSAKGRDLMETLHLVLSIPRPLIHCIMPGHEICEICSSLL